MILNGMMVSIVAATLFAGAPDLDVGDAAPDLSEATWLKGEAIDLEKLKGKKVVVVDFWATWCKPCRDIIPRMTALQKKYEGRLVVVGIATDEEIDKPKAFVAALGKGMDYTVGWDDGKGAYEDWMAASGQGAIPTAFVVDKKGRIAWIGDPLKDDLEDVVRAVVGGRYSIEDEKKVKALGRRYREAAEKGDAGAIKKLAGEASRLKSSTLRGEKIRFWIFVEAKSDEKAKGVGKTIMGLISDDANSLTNLAHTLLRDKRLKGRFTNIAEAMASRANDLTRERVWYVLDTLALAKFERGLFKEALAFQKKALFQAREEGVNEESLDELEESLKRYREAARK